MKLKRVQLVTMGGMGDYFSRSTYAVGDGGANRVLSLEMTASGGVIIVIDSVTGPQCRIIAPSMVLWAVPAELPPVVEEAGTAEPFGAAEELPVKRGPGRPPKPRAPEGVS